jgi:hypothetical protein
MDLKALAGKEVRSGQISEMTGLSRNPVRRALRQKGQSRLRCRNVKRSCMSSRNTLRGVNDRIALFIGHWYGGQLAGPRLNRQEDATKMARKCHEQP